MRLILPLSALFICLFSISSAAEETSDTQNLPNQYSGNSNYSNNTNNNSANANSNPINTNSINPNSNSINTNYSNNPASSGVPVYTNATQPIAIYSHSPEFIISLPSNPATGYRWSIENYDQKKLKLILSYYKPASGKLHVGGAGKMYWVFKATPYAFQTSDPSYIKLRYARPWNPNEFPKEMIFSVEFHF